MFVRAVELGGFSPAARALRMRPSAVSKLVARLEKRLGVRAPFSLPARGDVVAGDGEISRRLALAGQGVTRLSRIHIRPDIDAGQLVPVLEAYRPGEVTDKGIRMVSACFLPRVWVLRSHYHRP